MFKAFVVICIIAAPQSGEQCHVFSDTWGPYNTLENCVIRVDQMANEIFDDVNAYYPVTEIVGVCEPLEGELS
jgi:hypothetical protein